MCGAAERGGVRKPSRNGGVPAAAQDTAPDVHRIEHGSNPAAAQDAAQGIHRIEHGSNPAAAQDTAPGVLRIEPLSARATLGGHVAAQSTAARTATFPAAKRKTFPIFLLRIAVNPS